MINKLNKNVRNLFLFLRNGLRFSCEWKLRVELVNQHLSV